MSFQDYTAWFGIGSLIAVAVAVATYFRGMRSQDNKINDGFKEQNKSIVDLQTKIVMIETWVGIWKNVMEKELPKILIKPHREPIDTYMIKMQDEGLEKFTLEEMEDFLEQMRRVVRGEVPDARLDEDAMKMGYAFVIGNVSYHIMKRQFQAEKQQQEQKQQEQQEREQEYDKYQSRRNGGLFDRWFKK
jgi:hypothetical protein